MAQHLAPHVVRGAFIVILELPPPRGIVQRAPDKSGYSTPVGFLPGVTTVLGRTSATKDRLEQWLKRPDAQSISDAAKARGTWTHEAIETWIEAHSKGEPAPVLTHFSFGGYWRSIRPWLETHWTHAIAVEKPIFHPSGFAGSFDALAYVNYGENPQFTTLCDWKTSAKRRDDALVEDYKCQLAAYSMGIEYLYTIKPERALLVIARPASPPDVWEMSRDDLDDYEAQFRERLKAFYAMPPDE